MLRVFVIAAALLAALGCAGSEEEPAAQYAEPCGNATDQCAEGLECINGLCTQACTATPSCQALSSDSICASSYCYIGCTSGCRNGLICTQNQFGPSTCRP
jgi:hypothetical protein